MTLKFTPEILNAVPNDWSISCQDAELICRLFQNKFDEWLKASRIEVHGKWSDRDQTWSSFDGGPHKGILVCVEPIEICKHPREKVEVMSVSTCDSSMPGIDHVFYCACGAKVVPTAFSSTGERE